MLLFQLAIHSHTFFNGFLSLKTVGQIVNSWISNTKELFG